MKIVIQSTEIVQEDTLGKKLNLVVENGLISEITEAKVEGDEVIDGENLSVSAGWLDLNTFVGDPGEEQKEDLNSVASAAMAGGFTEIACLPNTKPVVHSKDVVSYIKNKCLSSLVTVHPVAAVTVNNNGEELAEMIDLHEAGAIAFSDGLKPIWHTDVLLKALQYTQKFNGVVIQRPDDNMLSINGQMNEGKVSTLLGLKGIPTLAEDLIVMRDLRVLEYTGGRLHFSMVSSPVAVGLIKDAKRKGLNVTCDVSAYNLALDDSELTSFDTNLKVNPPLRTKKDVTFLRKALQDGVIDFVVSGHRPHESETKDLEFDLAEFGMVGLESCFPVLNTFLDLSVTKLVEKLAVNPRKVLNIPVPMVKVGEKANLTVFDKSVEREFLKKDIKSKSKNSPFVGKKLKGKVVAVLNKSKFSINEY